MLILDNDECRAPTDDMDALGDDANDTALEAESTAFWYDSQAWCKDFCQ